MNKNIFRKRALERLRSPEQLDQLIRITSARSWLVALALALLLTSFIIWGFIGTIPTTINGQGILLKSGGIRNIVHLYEGKITDISVKPGDTVQEGDSIAIIEQYRLIEEILKLKDQLSQENDKIVINELEEKISQLQDEHAYRATVTSPFSGRVVEVKKNIGDILYSDQTVASIELSGDAIKDLEGIIYVSPYDGKKIIPGMDVKISPSFVKKEEYGYILGKVISVSEFPATEQQMLRFLGSEELVEIFSRQGAPIEVRVEITMDDDYYSGYRWTSPEGPPLKINSGTLVTSLITTGEQRPIELIIPINDYKGND
ncbi:MAG: NHLP bacteriocin system secretion protein [Halanaerobiales bacterium]